LADKEIEAVYIASPVIYHKEQVIAAAVAKKHILVEKPIGLSAMDSDEVVRICKEQGVLLSVGLMMRFHAQHCRMREMIQKGRLGDIVSMRAQLTCWYPEIAGNWRQKKSSAGGGALLDMGIHCIDLLQYISGSKVVRVAGMVGIKTFSYDVEDSASVLMEMDNGAYAYVDANFNIPDAAAHNRLEIYGTKGSILAEGTISQVEGGKVDITIDEQGGYDAQQERGKDLKVASDVVLGNMYEKEIRAFGDAILGQKPMKIDAAETIWVQRVIEAAYRSSEQARFIKVQ
jgi:predicted dehydrogenase